MKGVVAKSYFDVVGASQDDGISCPEKTLAIQSSRDECDINVIVRKYQQTGELPGQRQVLYADISEIGDLRDSLEKVQRAEEAFMALPAEVRQFFDNDPVNLVNFSANEQNYEKALELGLVSPRQQPSAPSAPVQGAKAGTEPASSTAPTK